MNMLIIIYLHSADALYNINCFCLVGVANVIIYSPTERNIHATYIRKCHTSYLAVYLIRG